MNNNGKKEKKTEFVEFWWPGIGIGILSLRALGSFACAFVCLHDTHTRTHTHTHAGVAAAPAPCGMMNALLLRLGIPQSAELCGRCS